jgi:hypothetical protein
VNLLTMALGCNINRHFGVSATVMTFRGWASGQALAVLCCTVPASLEVPWRAPWDAFWWASGSLEAQTPQRLFLATRMLTSHAPSKDSPWTGVLAGAAEAHQGSRVLLPVSFGASVARFHATLQVARHVS